MKKLVVVALAAAMPFLLNQTARAEKLRMPRQGTATYVAYYTSHSLSNLDLGEGGAASLIDVVGITRNADGQKFFDNMSVRCVYYRVIVNTDVKGTGACTETDTDGDKVFITFDAGARMHTLIGGTGKYQGISGTAPFKVNALPAPGQDLGAFIVEHRVTWQFK